MDHKVCKHEERVSYWEQNYARPAYRTRLISKATGERINKDRIPESWYRYLDEDTIRGIKMNPNQHKSSPVRPMPVCTGEGNSNKAMKRRAPPPEIDIGKRFCLQVVSTSSDGKPMYEVVEEVTRAAPAPKSYAECAASGSRYAPTRQEQRQDVRPKRTENVFASTDIRYRHLQEQPELPRREVRQRPTTSSGSHLQVARELCQVTQSRASVNSVTVADQSLQRQAGPGRKSATAAKRE